MLSGRENKRNSESKLGSIEDEDVIFSSKWREYSILDNFEPRVKIPRFVNILGFFLSN